MLNYREIIRLKSLGYSNLRVGNSCGSSRNTIDNVGTCWGMEIMEKFLKFDWMPMAMNNKICKIYIP